MGWQTKGGGSYYTRSRREGGRVVREYVGTGHTARLFAELDTLDRQRREAEREEQRQARQAEAEGARLTRWYVRAVENVLGAHLTAAGYRQHDRGQWRKTRQAEKRQANFGGDDMATELQTEIQETEIQEAATAELAQRKERRAEPERAARRETAIQAAAMPATKEERGAVLFAAMAGNEKLEAQALACLRAYPAETLLGWGNPKDSCLDLVSLSSPGPARRVMRAVVEREYHVKLKQVAGENPTPLETLLAERVTVLRFQITHYERLYQCSLEKGMSVHHSEHHLKRIERLHKQYVRAIESLAKVRRLQLPSVIVGQINVGDKQINVAAG